MQRLACAIILLLGSQLLLEQQLVVAEPSLQQLVPVNHTKQVALIIDDFGNNMKGTEEMLHLPIAFTAAVMPFMPSTKQDGELAHKLGHDVIVHMPMEPKQGNPKWLGPGAILTSMTDAEIRKRVEAAIDDVPYAIGMNNHMGSKVTGDERVMRIVLQVCKERGLFFIDSHTNYHTIAPRVARELGVPMAENQMFLDDQTTIAHITGQVRKLEELLQKHDRAIVIGHVGVGGEKTASVLANRVPQLQSSVSFVRVAEFTQITDK